MSADNEIEREKPPIGGDSIQLSAMIDKILANPELISMVASALGPIPKADSVIKEGESTAQTDKSEGDTAAAVETGARVDAADKFPELVAAIAPALSSLGIGNSAHAHASPKGDRRTCLLVALKPYLCRERCEAIDYMIKLGRLSEIFRTLG